MCSNFVGCLREYYYIADREVETKRNLNADCPKDCPVEATVVKFIEEAIVGRFKAGSILAEVGEVRGPPGIGHDPHLILGLDFGQLTRTVTSRQTQTNSMVKPRLASGRGALGCEPAEYGGVLGG